MKRANVYRAGWLCAKHFPVFLGTLLKESWGWLSSEPHLKERPVET